MVIRFLFLLMFIGASASHAEDSVSSAISIVDEFYNETVNLTGGLDGADAVLGFHKKAIVDKEKVSSELKSLKWTEAPGPRRFNQVYKLVDSYTEDQIDDVNDLAALLPAGSRPGVESAVKRLSTLKEERLRELNEALKREIYEKKTDRPIPIIDRSPFEKEPADGDIWYR